MAWTEERVEMLKKLWAEGWSASQIARELGEVTRNAVIGKVHRLGISARSTTPKHGRQPRAKTVRTAQPSKPSVATSATSGLRRPLARPQVSSLKPPTEPKAAPAPVIPTKFEVRIAGKPVSLMELTENICKWPIGNPGDPSFRFCGNPSDQGGPYCTDHMDMAYQPASSKRDRDRERRRAQRQMMTSR